MHTVLDYSFALEPIVTYCLRSDPKLFRFVLILSVYMWFPFFQAGNLFA